MFSGPYSSPLSFKDITALGMSCMADYGAPVFPFLAVGGYDSKADRKTHGHCHVSLYFHCFMIYALLSGEDYTNAEAFLLTISLNNYPREHPKFKVVQEWESRFLDIVQEYQKNPSTNFTFAYMAEVSLETLVLTRYIL